MRQIVAGAKCRRFAVVTGSGGCCDDLLSQKQMAVGKRRGLPLSCCFEQVVVLTPLCSRSRTILVVAFSSSSNSSSRSSSSSSSSSGGDVVVGVPWLQQQQ